jgi:hypothetical protein
MVPEAGFAVPLLWLKIVSSYECAFLYQRRRNDLAQAVSMLSLEVC